MENLKEIFQKAQLKAKEFTFEKMGENVMIYPCGFAWIFIKGKKSYLGKEFERNGIMKWDDYKKQYYYWVGDYNQSALHKEAHAQKLSEILSEELGEKIEFGSKLD